VDRNKKQKSILGKWSPGKAEQLTLTGRKGLAAALHLGGQPTQPRN
jgi:hypothetical protein